METLIFILAGSSLLIWLVILLLPWQPWNTGEIFYAQDAEIDPELEDVTVLIPARNEAAVIKRTLRSVVNQGSGINIILVDDESTDGTADIARDAGGEPCKFLEVKPLPEGWVGKLWALEQGRNELNSTYTLLLDADIELGSGVVNKMRETLINKDIQFMSLMVTPSMLSYWEKLLMPAFVYFFKLLYPFRLANDPLSKVAAAAGGCILMKTDIYEKIDGFKSIKGELIDGCSLASRVKSAGYRTWIGLTQSVRSIRPYRNLQDIWDMVVLTAFTQLRYSVLLLFLTSLIMLLVYFVPIVILVTSPGLARYLAVGALLAMLLTY
jgi:hopene-associated glycosyltransferase HpnB